MRVSGWRVISRLGPDSRGSDYWGTTASRSRSSYYAPQSPPRSPPAPEQMDRGFKSTISSKGLGAVKGACYCGSGIISKGAGPRCLISVVAIRAGSDRCHGRRRDWLRLRMTGDARGHRDLRSNHRQVYRSDRTTMDAETTRVTRRRPLRGPVSPLKTVSKRTFARTKHPSRDSRRRSHRQEARRYICPDSTGSSATVDASPQSSGSANR